MLGTLTEFEDRWTVSSLPGMLKHSLLTALLIILVAGAPTFAIGADCKQPPSLPPPESGQPRNLDGLKSHLAYYQCCGSYYRDFNLVIDKAMAYVLRRGTNDAKAALVLDIDETSIFNWEQINVNDFCD